MRRLLLRLRAGRRVAVGHDVRAGRGVRIEAAPGARVVLGDGCRIGDGSRLAARGGELRIGAGARIGERCVLVAHTGIDVGERATIGDWAAVLDAEPRAGDVETPLRAHGVDAAAVRIAPGAVVGPAARVLGGAVVDARVEAGTTVPRAR
ncbi:MAG TPA: hypothetical protein VFR97_00675 [Capillimicrobium sp.]|nr:hypothetical protein [Capillimicrobium sp.]